jgi:hypothetical protein
MSSKTYSAGSCQAILEETTILLEVYNRIEPDLSRLELLLKQHFQDDDSQGSDFRSYCCYGRPGGTVSLKLFNELCILPYTDYSIQLSKSLSSGLIAPSILEQDDRANYIANFAAKATANIVLILHGILKVHPQRDSILSYIPSEGVSSSWSIQIIGNLDKRYPYRLPSLSLLRERILLVLDLSLEAKGVNRRIKFFSSETGSFWQKSIDDSEDAHEIYLQCCSEFKNYLEKLLKDKGTTLDKLAGVEPSQRYPMVEAVVRDGFSRATQSGMESVDLLLEDGTLGGTVIAMHNEGFLSPEWIAAYLVDTDNNHFMVDKRSEKANNKDRRLRIFSPLHQFKVPIWMQFGRKKNVYLFMSDKASAAEEGWLKIVSYVINLLVDFINKRLVAATGSRYRLEHVVYDTGVASLSNPSVGSFARHQDGFHGLVDPSTPGYSRFMLMVPTFAIQNHCAITRFINFYEKGKTKKIATFSHDFLIQHWQLFGVNESFEHEVWLRSCHLNSLHPALLIHFLFCCSQTGLVIIERRSRSQRLS